MEDLKKEDNSLLNTFNNLLSQPQKTKSKKKKIKAKKHKKKKCSGLKELLEQINQEKLEKIKKIEEKDKKQEFKDEILIQSSVNENEEKNKIKEYINIINNSISDTTVATLSHDDCNDLQKTNLNVSKYSEFLELKPNYLIKNLEMSYEEKPKIHIKRKMSSPIYDYYYGYDKILRQIHKGSIDMTNSLNFIKKEDFISSGYLINNYKSNNYLKNYINPEIKNYKINNIIFENQYNDNIFYNERKNNDNLNNENGFENIKLDKNNNMNIFSEEYEYMSIPYSQIIEYMDYYFNRIPKCNLNSKYINYFNNQNEFKQNNKKYRKCKTKAKNKDNNLKNKSTYNKKGDWLCQNCFNLNFSFRNFCNRCRVPKH